MADLYEFNNVSPPSSLASSISDEDLEFTIQSGDGANYPEGLQHLLIDDEVVKVTSRSGDVFTVTERGFRGTSAVAHDADAPVDNVVVAESYGLRLDDDGMFVAQGGIDLDGNDLTNALDPSDEHGVGDRGFNDARYAALSHTILSHADASAGWVTEGVVPFSTADYNGIFRWLGEDKGTDSFQHPETDRGYVATSQISTVGSATSDAALNGALSAAITTSGSDRWWKVDFLPDARFTMEAWGIRAPNVSLIDLPVGFAIQGSNDDANWTDIEVVTASGLTLGNWVSNVVDDTTPYRWFRILLTETANLQLGEVEFWGTYEAVGVSEGDLLQWDGTKWVSVSALGDYLPLAGGTMTGGVEFQDSADVYFGPNSRIYFRGSDESDMISRGQMYGPISGGDDVHVYSPRRGDVTDNSFGRTRWVTMYEHPVTSDPVGLVDMQSLGEGTHGALTWIGADALGDAPKGGEVILLANTTGVGSATVSLRSKVTSPARASVVEVAAEVLRLTLPDQYFKGAEIVYDSSNVFDPDDYPGLRAVRFKVQGAGGAGGGAVTTTGGQVSVGSGGGAGAYGESTLLTVAELKAIEHPCVIWVANGAAGVSGTTGGTGGVTRVGPSGTPIIECLGGVGGVTLGAGSSVDGVEGGLGGGGLSSSSHLALGENGGDGGASIRLSGTRAWGGRGGEARWGHGGPERWSTGATTVSNTKGRGGGGGGRLNGQNQSAAAGANGGGGRVIVELYY